MAKVSGPLMSLDARNSFAGALVFTYWKGRNVVRQLVTPSNPQSLGQSEARTMVRVGGIAQSWANMTAMIYPGETLTDKIRLRDSAPPGQAWNGYLIKSMVGIAQANWDAGQVIWDALTAPQKSAWDTAAAALTPAIVGTVTAPQAGEVPTAITAGEVFFMYVYGLYSAGLATVPGAVPPVYA